MVDMERGVEIGEIRDSFMQFDLQFVEDFWAKALFIWGFAGFKPPG